MRIILIFITIAFVIFITPRIIFSQQKIQQQRLPQPDNIKGLHITTGAASGRSKWAVNLRNEFINIAKTTEINSIVIDVKEVCGPDYNEAVLKNFLQKLHENNIWAIARIVVFKDASQINYHPDWYLKRNIPIEVAPGCANIQQSQSSSAIFWRDKAGGYWLDPANPAVQNYILNFSEKMTDLGFNEIQFDYFRFPSDGDTENAIYPFYDKKSSKREILKNFALFLKKHLKAYNPNIILSVDLFGYAALHADIGVGQYLDDMASNFDYISFMLYPSHYYNGFALPADAQHNLPVVNFDKEGAREHPDIIVGRSLLFAKEYLDHIHSNIKLRPWLEDFFHEKDRLAGRPFGIQKIKLQIEAAKQAGANGWLLWNSENIYNRIKYGL